MSAVDVYRLQQAKIIFNDSSIVGGESFKVVDENGKTTSFNVPSLVGDAKFAKLIEGGHVYKLLQVEDDSERTIFENQIIKGGDVLAPSFWDGFIYNEGTWGISPESFSKISGSGKTSTVTLGTSNIEVYSECECYASTASGYTNAGLSNLIKAQKLKPYNNIYIDLGYWASCSYATGGHQYSNADVNIYIHNTTKEAELASKSAYSYRGGYMTSVATGRNIHTFDTSGYDWDDNDLIDIRVQCTGSCKNTTNMSYSMVKGYVYKIYVE